MPLISLKTITTSLQFSVILTVQSKSFYWKFGGLLQYLKVMATGNDMSKHNDRRFPIGVHVFPLVRKDSVTKESMETKGPENRATLYRRLTENRESQFRKRTETEVKQSSKKTEQEDKQRTNLPNKAPDNRTEHNSNPFIKPADDTKNPFKSADETSDLRVQVEGRPLYVTNPSNKPADDIENPFKLADDTSDLRLLVEGRPLYVSKVILTLISPVFKRYAKFLYH